jgi:hypothetical protein
VRVEKLELNDMQNILFYRDCDLMNDNVSLMNKYSELHWAAVSSLVYAAQTAVCQLLFTR